VHKALGPGLLESAYQECLFYKLNQVGFVVQKEKPMPLIFEEVKLECGYRIDILVVNVFLYSITGAIRSEPVDVVIILEFGSFIAQFISEYA
jgi:GxxExxY protein